MRTASSIPPLLRMPLAWALLVLSLLLALDGWLGREQHSDHATRAAGDVEVAQRGEAQAAGSGGSDHGGDGAGRPGARHEAR